MKLIEYMDFSPEGTFDILAHENTRQHFSTRAGAILNSEIIHTQKKKRTKNVSQNKP